MSNDDNPCTLSRDAFINMHGEQRVTRVFKKDPVTYYEGSIGDKFDIVLEKHLSPTDPRSVLINEISDWIHGHVTYIPTGQHVFSFSVTEPVEDEDE